MRKTTKKRLLFSIILCLLYMFCMTGCYGNIETSEIENSLPATKGSITSLELVYPTDIIVKPSDANYKKTGTCRVKFESSDNNDYKNIQWISTNPEVATVETGIHVSDYFYGKITVVGEGQSSIYAQTADGSIITEKCIRVFSGEKEEGKCYIESLSITPEEGMIIQSNTTSAGLNLLYDSLFNDEAQYITWVSSNPDVATVSSSDNAISNRLIGYIHIISEGQTEVYAQTLDGSVISNKVTVFVGSKYDKNAAVRLGINKYVTSRLKYERIYDTENHDETIFKRNWKRSYVVVTDTQIADDNTVVVKGYANTHNANVVNVICNFVIKVRYNNDFTSYEMLSEQYDVPEVIREKLD